MAQKWVLDLVDWMAAMLVCLKACQKVVKMAVLLAGSMVLNMAAK